MIGIVIVAVVGIFVAASLDPTVREYLLRHTQDISAVVVVIAALILVSNVPFSVLANDLSPTFQLAVIYAFGVVGLVLISRVRFARSKLEAFALLAFGLLLIVASALVLHSIRIIRKR